MVSTAFTARRIILGVVAVAVAATSGTAALAAKPSGSGNVKHDTAPPSVTFTQPSSGATLSSKVVVAGTASDNVGVSSVQTSVDGGSWTAASGTSSWSTSVDTSSYANGAHTLYARATDTSGNVTTTTLAVSFSNGDTTAPAVSFAAPTGGSTVGGTTTVTGSASDNVSVASVAVQVDGGAWQGASGTSSWSWSWTTSNVANGTHTLTAKATDSAGNVTTHSESVTVSNSTADTTPPAVGISSPASGATVSGTVSVTGTASDNSSLSSVAVQVDGGAWQSASGTSSWSWSWGTATYANGSHTVTAKATDTAGNTATTSVTVNVSNSSVAPSTQGSWVSPEGVHINVNTAANWTISQVYGMLQANGLDLSSIGPTMTINLQDTYATQTTTSAGLSNGVYSNYRSTMWLQATASSGFTAQPDTAFAHEFGEIWSQYFYYIVHNASWSAYESERWTTSNGSTTLATDSRTGSSLTWYPAEIVAEDYRLLFGSSAAINEKPTADNTSIPDPRNQPGLKDWLLTTWR